MRNVSTLLLFILISHFALNAQSKSDIAIALYQKAENAYSIADYETAFNSIKQAEQTLGSTNTKLLYLKIKSLEMLTKADAKYLPDIQQSLTVFFNMVDKSTYPQNKYSELLLIDTEIKQRIRDEESAYNRIKNSGDIAVYDNFFSQFPNSRYKTMLEGKYKELQVEQKAEMQRKFQEQWKEENLPLYRKQRGKGIGMLVSGSVLLVSGAAMMGKGWSEFDPDRRLRNTNATNFAIGMSGVGLAFIGLVLVPTSSVHFKEAKRIKRDARNNNIELSFLQQSNSVGLALNF